MTRSRRVVAETVADAVLVDQLNETPCIVVAIEHTVTERVDALDEQTVGRIAVFGPLLRTVGERRGPPREVVLIDSCVPSGWSRESAGRPDRSRIGCAARAHR